MSQNQEPNLPLNVEEQPQIEVGVGENRAKWYWYHLGNQESTTNIHPVVVGTVFNLIQESTHENCNMNN